MGSLTALFAADGGEVGDVGDFPSAYFLRVRADRLLEIELVGLRGRKI